jgi:hypothetical protein
MNLGALPPRSDATGGGTSPPPVKEPLALR